MSKRFISEEWSDDDIEDNEGLVESQSKRYKGRQRFTNNNKSIKESDESSKSANNLLKSLVNSLSTGFTSIMSNSYKFFTSKPNTNESYETVRNETQLRNRGMNSIAIVTNSTTNMSYTMTATNHNLQQNNYKIVNLINSSPCNVLIVNNQPIAQSVLSIIPSQSLISNTMSNTTTNPLVLCHNQNNVNMETIKCHICGQITSSPGRGCGHCGRKKQIALNPRRTSLSSPTIPVHKFYLSNNNNDSKSTALHSLPTICSPHVNSNQPVRRLATNSSPRLNLSKSTRNQKPECIVLDEGESNANEMPNKTNFNSANDECIEIPDSNTTDEAFIDTGIQCDSVDNENIFNNNEKLKQINDNKSVENKSDVESKSSNSSNSSDAKPTVTLNHQSYPEYVMFGTYRSNAKTMDFDTDGIKFTNVSPNSMETKFKYHIMIPFIEMQELMFCRNASLNAIFVKPTKVSNDKIQECMYLGKDSKNGLKFDIDSRDKKEHYIIAVVKDLFNERFTHGLEESAKNNNSNIFCCGINVDKAKHLLNLAQSRSANMGSGEQRFEQIIQSANSMKSPISRLSGVRSNPFAANAARSKLNSNDNSIYRSSVTTPYPKRPIYRTPRKSLSQYQSPAATVIQIDDDDEEDTETNNELGDEFDLNSKVILTYPKDEENAIQLSGNDICCLNKGEFLNDNIVNFYLRYYSKNQMPDEMISRTHIFDTLFFLQLTEKRPTKRKNFMGREEQYTFEQRYNQKLKNWTKMVDIFSKDFLIFPIIKESHWFLAIVCNANTVSVINDKTELKKPLEESEANEVEKRPCIIFMDSLGNASYKKQLSNPIREFLTYEWKEKKGSEISFKDKKQIRDFFPPVPNQTNSSDCGLFVLQYIEQFLSKPDYLVKKLFKDPKKALIDWFPAAEAKYKRLPIRNLILGLISPEMADKLKTLIKDDKESDDERDEIGMDCDFIDDKDEDYVDKDSIEELSPDSSNKRRTRSTTSKSIKICETPTKDSNTIDLVESNEDICSQLKKSTSYDSVVINDEEIDISPVKEASNPIDISPDN